MAITGSSGATPRLSRRTVLTGAAALIAGAAGVPARPARAAQAPRIRAAAAGWSGRDGELLVLTEESEPTGAADYALRVLEPAGAAEPGAAVTGALGPPLPLPLPGDFAPHSMAATGPVLWVTGARELAPDRVRPALVRIENGVGGYVDLPVPEDVRSGVATAASPLGSGLAVAIEGGPGEHLAALSRSHLAVTADGARTWTGRRLADDLGEGYGTVLTETDRGLFAAVADGAGTQFAFTGRLTEATALVLAPAGTLPGAGRPMAAVAAAAHVSLFSDRDGAITETRFAPGRTESGTGGTARDCACLGEVLAVPGRRGLRLETDGTTIHIRGLD
ncbi:hypothetical protein [Glycomyces albidus]|uniref:Twin-arginine translocation signal domain-containing protein n=1 Tax=Glycomyces albidus TaxID=2656774 RepID=A0A6L5GCM2_9ACTN|nr:hypothetical protein [Glycomyces albidus]MQM27432.1 hypothetical protein [Glycomyces albidus]